jgi:hypothetical protein
MMRHGGQLVEVISRMTGFLDFQNLILEVAVVDLDNLDVFGCRRQ